jgi:antitoxin HicB
LVVGQPDSVHGGRRHDGSAAWLYQEVTEDPEGGSATGEGSQSQFGEMSMSKHIGSKFDNFLDEEGLLAEVEAVAAKRVIAFQLRELMKKQKLTKVQLAKRMNTSRSALERLLDPDNVSVTLLTLERAARALGKSIRIELAA